MKADGSATNPIRDQEKIQNQNRAKHWWASPSPPSSAQAIRKPGPGTWGSVAAVLFWAAFAFAVHPSTLTLTLALTLGIVVATVLGVPAATIVERQSGRTDPGYRGHRRSHRPMDRAPRQPRRLASRPHRSRALPPLRHHQAISRCGRLERLPGGWGIVFDDVAAGLYALGVASLVRIWI